MLKAYCDLGVVFNQMFNKALKLFSRKKRRQHSRTTGKSLIQLFRQFATKTQLRDSETSFVPQTSVLCHTKWEECSLLSAQIELERAKFSNFLALTDDEGRYENHHIPCH